MDFFRQLLIRAVYDVGKQWGLLLITLVLSIGGWILALPWPILVLLFWGALVLTFFTAHRIEQWKESRNRQQQVGSDRQVVVQRLTKLADQGTTTLQNRSVQSELEVYHLWAEYGAWQKEILTVMEQHHCRLSHIAQVRTLDNFSSRGFSGINEADKQVRELIAETVARLRDIIRQIEQ